VTFRRPDGSETDALSFDGNVNAVRVVANAARAAADPQQTSSIEIRSPYGDAAVTCRLSRGAAVPVKLMASPSRASLEVTRQTMQQVTVKVRNEGAPAGKTIARASRPSLVDIAPQEAYLTSGSESEFRIRPAFSGLRPGTHQVAISFSTESGESSASVQVTIQVRRGPWQDIGRRLFRPRR
jgi:hypothetical protein